MSREQTRIRRQPAQAGTLVAIIGRGGALERALAWLLLAASAVLVMGLVVTG